MRMWGLHVSGDKQKSAPLAMEILERPSKSKVPKTMGFPKTKSLQSKVHDLKLHRLAGKSILATWALEWLVVPQCLMCVSRL